MKWTYIVRNPNGTRNEFINISTPPDQYASILAQYGMTIESYKQEIVEDTTGRGDRLPETDTITEVIQAGAIVSNDPSDVILTISDHDPAPAPTQAAASVLPMLVLVGLGWFLMES